MLRMRNPMSLLTTALTSTLTAAAALAPALASAQSAADYPAKSVRVVVAQAPGGGTDIQARLFSAKLSENLGKQFLVENRAGAGNTIGIMYVLKAPPDGYTLLASTPGLTFAPAIQKNASYDPVKDFTPISNVTRAPYLLVVHPSVPATTMQELFAYAKANPGKLNAGAGSGTLTHIAMAWMSDLAGIQLNHIPYKGTGPVLIDIVGGRLQVAFGNPLSTLTLVKAGKLRALAVTSAQRAPAAPELPTLAESGLKGFDVSSWYGLMAPAATPRDIVARLQAEIALIVALPEVKAGLEAQGLYPVANRPDVFAAQIRAETARWARVIREADIKPE